MIEKYLTRARDTGSPLETLPLASNQETLQHTKEQYLKIDWSRYETVYGNEDTPLKFLLAKDNEKDALVRILFPGSEYPVVVRIPEENVHPDLANLTEFWFNIENKVMLDETTLWLLGEIGSRYNRRQPMILEGMPAVSKTFVTWVFACIVGQPYDRLSFSAGSKETEIRGGRTPDVVRKIRPDLDRVMNSVALKKRVEKLNKKPEEQRSPAENDFLLYHEVILELIAKADADQQELFYTAELMQAIINISLIVETQLGWKDTNFSKILEHGGICALDEINTVADMRVVEIILPSIEVNNTNIPMPDARGANIKKNPDAMIIAAQNPPSVGGRSPLTDAFESRCQKVIVPNITEEYIQNVLTFFMTGNDPDIRINGKLMKGRKDVPTPQREFLENMPKRDLVIKAIAKLHVAIAEMVNKQVIGRNKREGGSYVVDQRDISAMLDSMIGTINRDMVKDTPTGIEAVDIDWVYVVKKALRECYVACLPGDETTGDYQKVNDLIEQQPIWNIINRAQNNVPVYVDPSIKIETDVATGGEVPEW